MTRNVSITLQNTADARPIIEAITEDNPEATVADFPSMVKIDCPGRLVVKQDSVSERIGREWDVQELHLSLITLSGNIDEDDDQFVLAWT
ncbi:MAG: MmoB/DmpM family protein [Rhodobacterales bacterium]|nr:MmoB/DmpM family protein [Rhodobacterales bacterium]